MVRTLVNLTLADVQYEIGELGIVRDANGNIIRTNDAWEGSLPHAILHGIAGCAAGAALNGGQGCAAGAAGIDIKFPVDHPFNGAFINGSGVLNSIVTYVANGVAGAAIEEVANVYGHNAFAVEKLVAKAMINCLAAEAKGANRRFVGRRWYVDAPLRVERMRKLLQSCWI